ncbi:MAG: hypothetical protein OZ921_05875 [Sorangiineae bacterium]|nr:hypothetical protein [Polyangiaceae bacterium]MEB2322022.1 hypothetical protein [Sorangiineae bacterium]
MSRSRRPASPLAGPRANPHLHVVFLDGTYVERDGELVWTPRGHLKTSEVGDVLEQALRRIDKHLRRHGLLERDEDGDGDGVDPKLALATSAVSGQVPPACPPWTRGLVPLAPHPLTYDTPLRASLDGFTLHAATRAGALDLRGREITAKTVTRHGPLPPDPDS